MTGDVDTCPYCGAKHQSATAPMWYGTMADSQMAVSQADVLAKPNLTVRDIDLDAFADGVMAHRIRLPFHACPHPSNSVAGLSWRLGWNERALRDCAGRA
jgi:hypothetical protein